MWWTLLILYNPAERCGRRSGSWQACGGCFWSVAIPRCRRKPPRKTVRQRRNAICFPLINDARWRAFDAAVFHQLKKEESLKEPFNCTHGDRAASRGISKFSATATAHACRRDIFLRTQHRYLLWAADVERDPLHKKLGIPLEAWAASCRFPLVSLRQSVPDERDVEFVLGSRYGE